MLQRYRRWVQLIVPTTLQGEVARRFEQAHALIADMLGQTAVQMVNAISIASGEVPADALVFIGSERRMPRYAGESDLTYAIRLQGAWTAHSRTGTEPAITGQFAALGLNAYVRDALQWNWDGDMEWPTRIWTVVTDHPYAEWVVGEDVTIGDDLVIGIDASPAEIGLMRGIARQWKPGHVKSSQLIFVTDKTRWALEQPDGTWGDDTLRSDSAIYIEG